MIASSKNNRENYPRKCFWTQEKETRVKFNPGLSARLSQFRQRRKDSLKIIWAWKGIGTYDPCNSYVITVQCSTKLSYQGKWEMVCLWVCNILVQDKDITCVCNCDDLSREIVKFHIFTFILRYIHAHICVVILMAPAALSAKSVIKYPLNTINFCGYSSTLVSFLSTSFMPKMICHIKQGKVNDTITARYKGTQTVSQTSIYIFAIWLKWVYQTP